MPDKTNPTMRGTIAKVRQAAWALRNAPTPAEAILWEALRKRQAGGLRFRRQHPVGSYVLDFYCPARKLVVELDGDAHDEPEQHGRDADRTAQLTAFGYRVLRVRNEEVFRDLEGVLQRIVVAADGELFLDGTNGAEVTGRVLAGQNETEDAP